MMKSHESKAIAGAVDWAKHDSYSEETCECFSGHVFRSHATYVTNIGIISRKPCPVCEHHQLQRASSDPEKMTL